MGHLVKLCPGSMRKGRGEVAVAAVAVEVRASTREQAKAMSVVDIVVKILSSDLDCLKICFCLHQMKVVNVERPRYASMEERDVYVGLK